MHSIDCSKRELFVQQLVSEKLTFHFEDNILYLCVFKNLFLRTKFYIFGFFKVDHSYIFTV